MRIRTMINTFSSELSNRAQPWCISHSGELFIITDVSMIHVLMTAFKQQSQLCISGSLERLTYSLLFTDLVRCLLAVIRAH